MSPVEVVGLDCIIDVYGNIQIELSKAVNLLRRNKMVPSITRRQFLKTSTAGSLSLASLGCSSLAPTMSPASSAYPRSGDYNIYFGDLHNHNEVGYARGSLERAYEIAAEHLDFFAFTPHGYWHDIGHYENNIEKKWLDGFEVTKRRWPEVLQMAVS